MKQYSSLLIAFFISITFINSVVSQNKAIEIQGKVIDEYNMGIPYVAVGIPSKYLGTATTEEGDFILSLSKEHLSDSLSISSIGYKSFKILVKDYIKLKEKVIILEEDIAELSEVNIESPATIVKNALKNIKNATISKPHQLNLLYRRFSVEDGKARFFVEHYLKAIDRGPNATTFDDIEILEGRKSADYRFVKVKQKNHAAQIMNWCNALRTRDGFNKYKWKRKGDTTYDGEDIIIIEGSRWKNDYLRLYIGMDTYGIYKIENSALNSTYIYQKNIDGKLYLSYHNREYKSQKKITPQMQKILGKKKPQVKTAYRHEMFVLGIETDKKKIKLRGNGELNKDIGDIKVPFNMNFWNNFAAPPATKFYTKNIKEIESIYGVPIATQFKAVNK